MRKESRTLRILAIGGVAVLGLALGCGFWWGHPFDSYLLHRWASELNTLSDAEVPSRLDQIAALGDQSFPTLVTALHSERQIVAEHASLVLQRELGQLELRSTKDTSRLVAVLATELASHHAAPGPYSGPGSMWLATRILLWPIDRKLVDAERVVADCESIIRSVKALPRGLVAESLDEERDPHDRSIATARGHDPAELVSPVAGGGLPVQLTDTPALPPQDTSAGSELHAVAIAEPQYFTPAKAPSAFDARPIQPTADDPETESLRQPQPGRELRRDLATVPRETTVRPDLQSMPDLDVMQKLASDDESLIHAAVDELYRRGFQTKHFRLAELLVDPDAEVRAQLVQSLPQMPGIDSRPWLLWLSRDQDPTVRKAAVAVIATSPDATLQQRIRDLEREETDEEVLQALRQILSSRQANSLR